MNGTEICTSRYPGVAPRPACILPAGHPGLHQGSSGQGWVGAEGMNRDGSRPAVRPSKPVVCARCSRSYGNLGGGQDSALAAYLTGWTRTQDGGWDCGCPSTTGWPREDELADDELQAQRHAEAAGVTEAQLGVARSEALRLLGIAPARIQWPDTRP